MGVKRQSSEYQRSFKVVHPSLAKLHERNVDYRAQRRHTEHNHHAEPFDWDPASETDSDLSVRERKQPQRELSIPKHVYKHEKFNRKYHDRLKKLTQQFECQVTVSDPAKDDVEAIPLSARSKDSGSQTDRVIQIDKAVNGTVETYPRLEAADLPQQRASQQRAPQQQHLTAEQNAPASKTKVIAKPKVAVRKPIPSKHVPEARPFSAPLGRPLKKDPCASKTERSPFVPYGFKDDECRTGSKKTYNVRASADIYPSALLAQKRRRAQIELRDQSAKSASYPQRRKQALFNEFNERVRRETSEWDTEYRRHYAGYDQGVYQRALSARPISRQHDPQLMLATW